MPRGFLVKRIKRTGGSYRARHAERLFPLPRPFPEETSGGAPRPPAEQEAPPAAREEPGKGAEDAVAAAREWPGSPCRAAGASPGPGAEWRGDGSEGAPSHHSPAKPAGAEPRRAFLERCLSSPVSAESFPGGGPALAPFSGSGSAAPTSAGEPFPPPPPRPEPVPALPGLPPRAPGGVKRPKAARRLSFADEVTTSPVLGLRIKAEEPGAAAAAAAAALGSRARGCSRAPLGAFICQLCKEQYADPLALAQHRCSRIVRVEYRCPECDKVFSCPANLASHRRWHKPRPPPPAAPPRPADGKENGRLEHAADQHPRPRDSSAAAAAAAARPGPGLQLPSLPEPPRPRAPYPDGVLGRPAGPAEIFVCPYCRKSFRRQAYLRKHLGTHEPGAPRALPPGLARPPCGTHLPSADGTDPHRLWLAVRDELLLPARPPSPAAAPDGAVPQTFCCKHCPSTFFSSPGLTRHINKCHPSESRQVLLLQLPLRPGC
ncbi:insulinoma-associated protein 2 [Suncus etruscus]|uniref:insulinoma-associated protein 2 n=1 Tax=Suncus etruscus TaxID=109475 RepID=UPI00210F6AA4|nr:insulinoma-associated protein 2 [Suncus etruscus]